MRYLRLLSNSVIAAVIATAYVLVLFLLLNPAWPLNAAPLEELVSTAGLFYVVHLIAIFYVLLVLRQLFAHELFSPAWISVGVLVWLCAMASAAGATLFFRNLWTFALVLDVRTSTALQDSALILASAAAACVLLATLRRSMPEARMVWALLLLLVVAGSIAGPLALRGRATPLALEARPIDAGVGVERNDSSAHVSVIAIDGASLDLITNATAEGRLPNFGRILDAGAVRHLATLHPTSAEAVWAAVATGKLPQKNGVRSAAIYQLGGGRESLQLLPDYCFAHGLERFGFLVEQSHTSATFRARPLWTILSVDGFSVGVVGWPLTEPPPVVRGFLVSDLFPRQVEAPAAFDKPPAVYPTEIEADARAAIGAAMADRPKSDIANADDTRGDPRHETAGRTDRISERIASTLASSHPVQVTLTRYQSLDSAGHYFLRYAIPSEFGDVVDDEHRRLEPVLESHYAMIDAAIGREMAALGPEDLLLVVSGYGMEPIGFGQRLVERAIGDPDISGTHEFAPDGFLLAYGASVLHGGRQVRASVVDVTPTILYFLGLPIGRDMDGYARTDLFQASFSRGRPITFIPTYDR